MHKPKKQQGLFSSNAGFSLIELLVVATIMTVLTTIGLVSYQRASRNSRNAKRKADLETVRQAVVLYRSDNSTYPTGSGTNASFLALLSTITDYLSTTSITDPKNEDPYVYTYNSDGSTFSLCGYIEDTTPTQYCVNNP